MNSQKAVGDSCLVGVPEAKDEPEDARRHLKSKIDAGHFTGADRERQSDQTGHQEHAEDRADTEDSQVKKTDERRFDLHQHEQRQRSRPGKPVNHPYHEWSDADALLRERRVGRGNIRCRQRRRLTTAQTALEGAA